MVISRLFVDGFLEAFRLVRGLIVQISNKRIQGRSSFHENLKVYVGQSDSGKLSVALDDSESYFYAVLHECDTVLRLVFSISLRSSEGYVLMTKVFGTAFFLCHYSLSPR